MSRHAYRGYEFDIFRDGRAWMTGEIAIPNEPDDLDSPFEMPEGLAIVTPGIAAWSYARCLRKAKRLIDCDARDRVARRAGTWPAGLTGRES